MAATGVNILSAAENHGYAELSGTSHAASHVTGTAALMMSAGVGDVNSDGVIDSKDIREWLQSTALDLGQTGQDDEYGYGLVDAEAAVTRDVSIDSVTFSKGTALITGSGFGNYRDTDNSETRVFINTTKKVGKGILAVTMTITGECDIIVRHETEIVVQCDATCGTIEVYSVYGTATFDVACNDRPVKKPEKRHKK